MPLSKYAAKVAAREEAARLAALRPEPEPLADAPPLDTFTPAQLERYRRMLTAWREEHGVIRPGSKVRRAMRARALQEVDVASA
jgi:hypothetical protein